MTCSQAVLALRRTFGSLKPPDKITQEAYDSTPKHLRRLVRLHSGERPEVRDLWEYMQDLLYGGEIQTSLLQFVLPFCLEAWREDLRGTNDAYGGFVEHFYPVLANKHVFDLHLEPRQTAAVSDFMRESILDEIDDQRGLSYRGASRPYRWIGALTTFGVLLPDVERLWTEWWSINSVGKAVAAVQYISCLMYSTSENPIFDPWTPDGGGGPPCLGEFQGHLYANRWLENNVAFLKQFLCPESARTALQRSVEKLANEPEQEAARGIQQDWPLCEETLASRCEELPRWLAMVSEPGRLMEWSL